MLVLWIARSLQRLQEWREVSPRKLVSYDVETRWNSTYTTIADVLRLRKELTQYIRTHPESENLLPSKEDWLLLGQIERVLKPFWDYTNVVSSDMPAIADSLAIHWSLDDLLTDVSTAHRDTRTQGVSARGGPACSQEGGEVHSQNGREHLVLCGDGAGSAHQDLVNHSAHPAGVEKK
ncbi:hypothetical protein LTR72_011123 [Exophiala xenobiotica]|nr:hypothetical protein LTR72_011123 [Exophiala xenobiotica]KAK5468983.1 hypothetical protein LTR55_011477 [Exophiala xenobiotica]